LAGVLRLFIFPEQALIMSVVLCLCCGIVRGDVVALTTVLLYCYRSSKTLYSKNFIVRTNFEP